MKKMGDIAKLGREGTPGHKKVGTSQDRPMETHRIGWRRIK